MLCLRFADNPIVVSKQPSNLCLDEELDIKMMINVVLGPSAYLDWLGIWWPLAGCQSDWGLRKVCDGVHCPLICGFPRQIWIHLQNNLARPIVVHERVYYPRILKGIVKHTVKYVLLPGLDLSGVLTPLWV